MSIENTNKSKQNQKNITKFDSLNLPVSKTTTNNTEKLQNQILSNNLITRLKK